MFAWSCLWYFRKEEIPTLELHTLPRSTIVKTDGTCDSCTNKTQVAWPCLWWYERQCIVYGVSFLPGQQSYTDLCFYHHHFSKASDKKKKKTDDKNFVLFAEVCGVVKCGKACTCKYTRKTQHDALHKWPHKVCKHALQRKWLSRKLVIYLQWQEMFWYLHNA